MSKNTAFIAIAGVCLIGLCAVLAVAVITAPQAEPSAIKDTLVGMNLTYSNLAGTPMNYTITANDIWAVEKLEYGGAPAWKVHVGQGLAWDLILDAEGKRILDIKQLFYT